MAGLGTLINLAGIIAGGVIGMLFGRALKGRLQSTLMKANGVCVLFIGIGGAVEQMMSIQNGVLTAGKSMMIIVCFMLGSLVGEAADIERRIEQFGGWLKKKSKSENDSSFIDGFVNTSLTICIGAMAVVGSIQDGISGDYSLLAAKAALDFIIVMVLTSTFGKGCIFSAIPVLLFQGIITFSAHYIEFLMTEQALSNLSLTGSMLIFCVGVNLVWGSKIKVGNMLPAIVFAAAWAFLPVQI